MLTLNIPPTRDPIARLSLIGCAVLICYAAFVSATAPESDSAHAEPIILIATPTLPVVPTAAPALVQAAPTAIPEQVLALVPPIVYAPTPEIVYAPPPPPIYVETAPEVIYVEPPPVVVEAPPVVTYITAVPETHQELPSGAAIIMTATPGVGDPGFVDSFTAPDPDARCAFVGCL